MKFIKPLIWTSVFGCLMPKISSAVPINNSYMEQQLRTISGKITDRENKPVTNVTISEIGGTAVTQTDIKGEFTLKLSSNAKYIRVHGLGIEEQQIVLTASAFYEIRTTGSVNSLDEVVVVGYGTQLRKNIVGAVSNLSGEALENRPNAYLTRSLQGQVPGVNITMVDGKPSRSATINIRGNTQSIGAGGSALTLVDGVESDLTAINPEDVESVSVLKDASSTAVYGARGAFGVVLVTTKGAKRDRISVNYSPSFSIFSQTVKPKFETNPEVWYDNYKLAHVSYAHRLPTGINNFFPWSQAWEDEFKKRINDPDNGYLDWDVNSNGVYQYYGSTNWYEEFYKDYTYGQQHNLNVSGGSKVADFVVSSRYFEQQGIYKIGDEKFGQMNLRAKGGVNITNRIRLENNTDFIRRNYHQPNGNPNDLTIPRLIEHQGFPVTKIRNPDGSWTAAAVYTGYAPMAEGNNYRDNFKFDLKNSTFLSINLIDKVLDFKADYSYLYNHSKRIDVVNSIGHSNISGVNLMYPLVSSLDQREYETEYQVANASINFTPKLSEKHYLNFLAGWNVEDKKYYSTQLARDGFLKADKPNFSLMDGINLTLQDLGSYSWGFNGIFYRASYNYEGKYLLEASGRYDGSSKFPVNQQWGFFPSASLGWRMSEEAFLKEVNWIDNLKWRFSIGSAGNGNVAPYLYMAMMNISKSTGVLTNGTKEANTASPAPIPASLTWEKATTKDLGLDVDLFGGRLNFVGDLYEKKTTDMFVVGAEIPAVAGYSAPKGNNADMVTKGFEVSLGYKGQFKLKDDDFSYNLRFSLWDSKSKITKYTSKTNTLPSLYSTAYYEGMTLGEIWGYTVDGLFATDEEAQDWGVSAQSKTFWSGDNVSWNAGDLRFADLDGNGIVDNGNNTLSNHGDLRIIGNSEPRYHFGFNVGGSYRGIGISAFFQGIMKRDWYPAGESGFFWGQYNRTYGYSLPWQNAERWTEENPDPNAYWPRLRGSLAASGRGTLRAANDRYLQDASYTRLKNLTIDYNFSNTLTKKMRVQSLRVYCSAENLFFWSPLKKHAKNYDPEQITAGDADYNARTGTDGEGYGYPQTKSISLGINVSF
ncbi:SusC/RagA family TonB-linked outer membrane protein [Sphingobacterium faecale]|uniref:TonB-dependent receptor n=1 Tax=Sphingobacterium faecale TaxID=2803775 RepID=A0ABS1QZ84_9SPHI|nr:TonB-dependent receptor [Sphingobacterium faecale]MBL1407624.1 TonB-dependent receptor [Sphingobacterium faecale]